MKKLPVIDVGKVVTLEEARNIIEQVVDLNVKLLDEVTQLKVEVARLKKQAKLPKYKPPKKRDYSASSAHKRHNSAGTEWSKSAKKSDIKIDKEVHLPEVDSCSCGSSDFKVLRSRKKVVQGIVIKRNNTCYLGNDKQCLSCSKI